MRARFGRRLAEWLKPHQLGRILGLNLTLVGLVGFALIMVFVGTLVSKRFSAMEQEQIGQHIERTRGMMMGLRTTLTSKSQSWGIWTEAYNFLLSGDEVFAENNTSLTALSNYDINMAVFSRFDGKIVRGAYYNLDTGKFDAAMTARLMAFARSPDFVARARASEYFSTFVRFGDKLIAVSSSRVRMSDNSGTPSGFILVGRNLERATMAQALGVPAWYDFTISPQSETATMNGNHVEIAVAAHGLDGAAIGTIHFSVPRDLKAAADSMLAFVALDIGLLVIGMIFVLQRRLKSLVTDPLTLMQAHVSEIQRTGKLTPLDLGQRHDEFGQLATDFNLMATQIDTLHAELEAQSFVLGREQSSIGLMHNVRNSLSPVGTILSRLNEDLFLPSRDDVSRALAELAMPDLPAARRERLTGFVAAALGQYDALLNNSRTLVREAGRNLSLTVETINQVQTGINQRPDIEPLDIHGFLATHLSVARYARSAVRDVDLAGDGNHRVLANQILLAQVIGNVLTNATEAIAATGRDDGQIKVTTRRVDESEVPMLCISIRDNGDGFDPERTSQLFTKGFSTRTEKTGGIGLHWCANTLNAMGGVLRLSSDGQGKGATAEILLPLAQDSHIESATDLAA